MTTIETGSGAGEPPSVRRTFATRMVGALVSPVDSANAIFFRVGFGTILCLWAIDYLRSGQIRYYYVAPKFHFTYWMFNWVHPWPGSGPYLHFSALAFLACLIAVGFAYRLSTILFAIGFSLFFLWDRTNYQNHYYLILLMSWLMAVLPLNRPGALDALQRPQSCSPVIPAWVVWALRFHAALPYVFGGIAKLNGEWLSGGGLRGYLLTKTTLPLVGPWLATANAAVMLAWAGMLFDLLIVPLLLWKRTRVLAYLVAVLFHAINHFLFSIHIFPWFMMMATTVFFEPGWPRLFSGSPRPLSANAPRNLGTFSWSRRWGFALLAFYMGLQLLLPLRSLVYEGDVGWHEQGHYFSWRMMLRTKLSAMRLYMTDSVTATPGTWTCDSI